MTQKPSSFLIIQTAFIGDVILATPIIEKLHQYYPNATIDFLVRKGNEGLLEGHPKLREVLIWKKKQEKYRHLFRLMHHVRAQHYDVIVNVHRFAASGFLTGLSKTKHKTGFDKNPFSFFYHKKISHQIGDGTHEVERNLRLIEHLTDGTFVRPVLYPSKNDFETVKSYQSKSYVCIAPTSVWFTKQFPKEKWLELIQKLPQQNNIFLLGSPADHATCQWIKNAAQYPHIHNLAGQLSLLQSAALIRNAEMTYTNDSAPMHLASAMNTPVTAVFCSTVPEFGFGPLSDEAHVVQTSKELACRPCGLHGKKACPEGHFDCAYDIEVE